jgi:PKD repeat protein
MKKNTLRFFFRILFFLFCSSSVKAQTTSLITPVNHFNHSTDSIFFSWNSVTNASFYELNVAEDAAFTLNNKLYKIYNSTDTILKNSGSCKTFFWRVRAYTPAPNPYSFVSTFTVYTPACIPGLEIWMDASSGVMVNGSNEISVWQDKSGKNKNAIQPTAGNKPILLKETAATSNKSSFARLDGTDDFLTIDSVAKIGSVFSVFKWRGSLPNFSGYNTVFMSKVAKPRGLILVGSAGSPNYYVDGSFNTFSPSEFEVNGVNTVSLAPLDRLKMVTGIAGTPVNLQSFYIGQYPNDPGGFWNGDIGDIIVYDHPVTVPQKASLQNYLNDKYAPPVNLGPDKTVCGFPITLKAQKDYYINYLWQNSSTADSIIVNAPGTYFVTTTNVFGKTSSDTVIINQSVTPYTVKLGIDICSDKAVALNAGPDFYTYAWSTGAVTNKINVAATGTYSVSVTDCLGNISKDTINITVHPLPSFSLGADETLCYYAKDTLDPGFANSLSYTFLWSDNSTDSTLVVNHAGNYTVLVTDNKGCFYKDTIKITIDSSLFAASLGADFSACAGNPIYLKTGAAAVTTYLWSDGSTNDSLQILTTGQYHVRVSNAGTCFKRDTINVTVIGTAPVANFTVNNVCAGKTTLFTDQSMPPPSETIIQWTWDFGDTQSATVANPTHTYADTGTYTVRLTVKTLAGCEAAINKPAKVYPKPAADFSLVTSTCDNSATQFSGTALTFGYPIAQWKWGFSDPASGVNNVSTIQNPVHHFSTATNYAVKLMVTNNNSCTDSIIKNIVPPLPQIYPQPLLPADKYSAAASDVSFSWSAVCGSSYYELSIADDINFLINAKVYKVYTADTIVKNFTSCKTYYWRVRAFAPLITPYSIAYSFSTFSPDCTPGLEMWMDASSGVTVNGSNEISLWQDKSGKNKNATQATAGNKPLLLTETAATSNKSSFARLDGTDDFFNIDSSAKIGSVFSVFKWRGSLPNFSGYNTVFMSKVAKPKGLILVGNVASSNYYVDGSFNTFDPPEFEVNGVNTVSFAPLDRLKMVTGIAATPVNLQSFYIGQYPNDPGAFWNGDIGDIIVYDHPVTAPQKVSIQNYLNDKYAPGVYLGPDKTVCGFPVTLKAKKDYYINYLWQNASTADSIIINAPGTYFVTVTNVFGKTSSDTVIIKQSGIPYTVKLGNDMCSDKAVTLNAGPDYYTYSWSTGATTHTISAATTGTYSVAVTDCLGNISKDTINITVHPLPSFSLGTDETLCYYAKDTLDPGFANSLSYTFLWSDNSTDSTLVINHAGNYSLLVTDNKGCFYKDTIKIAIDSSLFTASLGADFSTCAGNPIYLKTGAAAVTTYLWSDGSTNDSLQVLTTGQYHVRVSNAGNCFKRDTINVTVFGTAPVANFKVNNVCAGEVSTFTDQSIPPAGESITQWTWDFGDGIGSTSANPTHTYADTGTYTVRLTVKTLAGCEAAINKQAKVYPKPDADFSQTTAACDNSATQFFGTALTFGYPIVEWKWDFSDPSTGVNNVSNLQNPVHRFSSAINFAVKLIVKNSNGCTDTITKNVPAQLPQIHPQPLLPADKYIANASAVSFAWSAICGSMRFELNIADDTNFLVNVKVYNVYNLTADTIINNFTTCKKYYWRVRAFAPLATPYSAVSTFSTFSPECIAGLDVWMDATSGIVKNSSDLVSRWKDKSNNKKDATQTATAAQPLFYKETAATSNKSSFVRLDGTDDFLSIDTSAKIGSVFSVFKWRGTLPNFSGYNALLMSQVAKPKGLILVGNVGSPNYYVDGSFNMFAPSEFEVNGVNTLSMAPLERLKMVNGISGLPNSQPNFYIGKYPNDGSSFWNGDVGDIIVYTSALSVPQKVSIQNYLNDKYAPPVNLGGDRTVCGFPVTIKAKKDYFTSYVWQNASTADSLIVNAPGTYYVTATNVFGRNSSDTIVVNQNMVGYVVNLGKNDTAVCAGQTVRLNAGPDYLSYLWSNGSTSNMIEIATAGTYMVEVKDCTGKISRDTVNLTVHALPVFSFGKDTLVCNGINYQLDPGFLNSKNLTFNWFDNTHDSIHLANQTGTYTLKVINQYACSFADTIKVGIDSLIQLATLGPDTSFCAGNFIYLKNGASKAATYLWSTGSVNDSIPVTISGTYWVTATSINNCPASDTITVNVAGIAPNPKFSYTLACQGKLINFTDLSTAVPGKTITSWSWNFGDTFTSTLQHPTHKFSDTLSYVVKLTVTMDDGCSAPIAKVVKVYPVPKPTFVVANSCEQSVAQFTSTVAATGHPVTQWNWNFGEPSSGAANVSTLKNPVHKFAAAGTYKVRLIATNVLGCIDTIINDVIIKPVPVADFTSSIACKFNNVLFTDKTALPPGNTIQTSYWNFGDNVTSALVNPVHVYLANVNFNVLHVVTASNGCKDTIKKTISVYPSPTAYFSNSKICQDTITTFNDISVVSGGTITKWKWSFNGVDSSVVKNAAYTFTKSGTASVVLIITTDKGCKDTVQKTIVVNPKPIAAFTYTPTYGNPKLTVNFTNTTTGTGLTYLWNFNDGNTSTLTNPVHIYADTGIYKPFLTARNTLGCSDTASGVITILKRRMDVAMGDFVATLQNGFLNLNGLITNKGTADVLAMDIYIKIAGGATIRESWTGRLLKGATVMNTFKTSIQMEDLDHFICVTLANPNGFADEYPPDNERCEALDVSEFKVLEIYPNPVADMVTIPVVAPEAGNVNITLYDAQGQLIRTVYSGIALKGLQLIALETHDLNSGLYSCKIEYVDYVIVKKIIKK